jgi:hypothetical protein
LVIAAVRFVLPTLAAAGLAPLDPLRAVVVVGAVAALADPSTRALGCWPARWVIWAAMTAILAIELDPPQIGAGGATPPSLLWPLLPLPIAIFAGLARARAVS